MAVNNKAQYYKITKVHQNHAVFEEMGRVLTYALETELVGVRIKVTQTDLLADRPLSDEAMDFYHFCDFKELNWFEILWFDLGTVVAFLMQREYYD